MAAMSDYLESGILNHLFRGVGFSIPTNISIALTRTVPTENQTGATISEVPALSMGSSGVDTGYSRVNICNPSVDSTKFTYFPQNHGNDSGVMKNFGQVVFNTALTDWGPVSGVAILDSSVRGSGNMLMYAALDNPRSIFTGDSLKFSSAEIAIILK
jgi:hypothetical protein